MIKINNTLIIKFFLIYVLLTAVNRLTHIEAIKPLIFAFTISILLIFIKYILNNISFLKKSFFYFVFFLTFMLLISLIINLNHTKISFSIKYFGIFVFFLVGYIINIKQEFILNEYQKQKKVILLIILIPLIIFLFESFILHIKESSSLFVNRNNAVLFGIISSYFILLFYKRILLFFVFIYSNIIIYTTLGALLASVASYILIYLSNISPKKLFKILFALFILIIISYYLYNYSNLHIVERLKSTVKGFVILFSYDSIEAMSKISYGQMASQVGSGDLSFLFRIKHWFNIILVNNNSDFIYWLFGHGNDSIITLTKAELRAHNDYIRLMFEVGFLYVVTFIMFNFYLVKKIGLNIYALPFLIVLMYFFTENLIDNFLAMSLLYYFVGMIIALKEKGEI
jgi:hypothetical protein